MANIDPQDRQEIIGRAYSLGYENETKGVRVRYPGFRGHF